MKAHSLPFSLSFIDLKNAFGSVSHKYILDMLRYIKVSTEVLGYIRNLYSSLSAYVFNKSWRASDFPIKRGVFQDDILSPVLFLIAFNPILQAVYSSSKRLFTHRKKEHQDSSQLVPRVGSFALWDGESSEKKSGWYLAKIVSLSAEGKATLLYCSGGCS